MTPKEKAIELFDFMYDDGDTEKSVAKIYAKKVIDEILLEFAENEAVYHKLRFWLEVKIEIEKL